MAQTSASCSGAGSATYQVWANVNGSAVGDIPTGSTPSSTAAIASFEAPAQSGFNYGARVRAYLCPPTSGAYTFWVVGDDAAELFLSTSDDPTKKVRIASCAGWTSGNRDFTRMVSQQSAPVQLTAGTRYYVEALHKQSWGPGYLAVAWRLPNGSRQEPIPGANLLPFASTTTTTPPPTTTPTTNPTSGTKARVTFTFSAPPASATSRIAPTLHNKSRVLQFEEDDSPIAVFTEVYPLFKGGVARNGVRYPGLRFTDGCGRNRPYTAAVAINGHNSYNNSVWLDPGPQHDAGRLVWAQAQELLDNRWDVENHSDLHTTTNPAQQIATLDALIANRLKGYKPSVHIVPTNFAGYPTAAFAAGYTAVSSGSQSDSYPMVNAWNSDRTALSALPAPTTPFVYNRYMADQNTSGGETTQTFLNRLKAVSDKLMAPGTNTSEVYLQRVFSHGMNFNVLVDWMNYTQSIAQDRLWVTTLREFAEYRRVSAQVVKTESLSGNTLTVDLDYANISANTRFQSLTLLVNSAGTLTNISVSGADSATFNTTTKMVNVYRGLASTTTTPTTTPTPSPTPTPTPTPSSCSGTGSATYQVWANVNGSAVGDIPTGSAPSSTAAIASFEAPAQSGFNYGARVRAYLCPPTSGAYTFWVVGDDAAELFLSTSDDPAKKVRIASCAGWTSGNRDFTRMASQQSAPVQLTAGTRYYVEALHKQSWGPGYLAVAWRLPNGTRQEPIPGANLLPFASTASLTSSATGSSATVAAAEAGTTASVYPNPVAGQGGRATVAFRLAQAGPVTLALYNLQGQRLRQLLADTRPAGELQHVPFDTNGLPDGVFFVRLITQHEVINTRFTITR